MQKEIVLPIGGLYVISAPPGAGKTTWLATHAPAGTVVSSDALRAQLFGMETVVNADGTLGLDIPQEASDGAFAMLDIILDARLKQRLTTFVDATSYAEEDRASYAEKARKHGVPYKVLILDVTEEECLARNAARERRVPESDIRRMYAEFKRTSAFPYELVGLNDTLRLQPNNLPHDRLDVIGDVHGMYDELMELLAKAGWDLSGKAPVHPEGRFLLFLGDVVDRGPKSVEMLKFVMGCVKAGVGEMVPGNHEVKLLKFLEQALTHKGRWSSTANAETGMHVLALPAKEQAEIVAFLKSRPTFMVRGDRRMVFCHADIVNFDPLTSLSERMIYGARKLGGERDSDAEWQRNQEAAEDGGWVLVRGHIPQVSEQTRVYSLERQAFQRGELVLMRVDRFLAGCKATGLGRKAFEQSLVTQKCAFDYRAHARKFRLAATLESLVADGLATRTQSGVFRLYKYSKRVFYDNLWDAAPGLLKARGIVLDLAGNVVSHTFDKVFNYGENCAGWGLPDTLNVVVVDKLNGFLGVVSANPLKKGELLVTTQGSFEGRFVEYVKQYVRERETRGAIGRYLARNNVTLMFEVCHPDDPHIIEYGPDMHGLHLIGVRGNGQLDKAWTEEQVDAAAAEMGLRRPAWRRMTLGQLKQELANAKHEGWMVRMDDEEQETLFKFKTPHYLVVKFLGRLSDGKIKHMFKSPESFKKDLDEEFFPLVDLLVARFEVGEFLEMPDTVRVGHVRESVFELLA